MFRHKNCGGIPVSKTVISLVSAPIISIQGVKPAKLAKLDFSKGQDGLFCSHCGKQITTADLEGHCFQCGVLFPANQLYLIDGISGVHCREHAESEYPERRRVLLSTIK